MQAARVPAGPQPPLLLQALPAVAAGRVRHTPGCAPPPPLQQQLLRRINRPPLEWRQMVRSPLQRQCRRSSQQPPHIPPGPQRLPGHPAAPFPLPSPAGSARVDAEVYRQLAATGKFAVMDAAADEAEHSLELHLPYIVHVMRGAAPGWTLVPIVVGAVSPDSGAPAAGCRWPLAGRGGRQGCASLPARGHIGGAAHPTQTLPC